jgi:hypothetical protein
MKVLEITGDPVIEYITLSNDGWIVVNESNFGEVTMSSEKEIISYGFGGVSHSVGISGDGTISVEVESGTDLTNLVAIFTLSENAQGATVSEVSQVSNTTANNFTGLVAYVVTAEDGTTRDWIVTVTIVDKSALITALGLANTKHDSAVEGIEAGQYAVGSKAIFMTAIDAAQAVANSGPATQIEVNQARVDLATAEGIFDAAQIEL